jgi:hypothetical protein
MSTWSGIAFARRKRSRVSTGGAGFRFASIRACVSRTCASAIWASRSEAVDFFGETTRNQPAAAINATAPRATASWTGGESFGRFIRAVLFGVTTVVLTRACSRCGRRP